MKQSNFFIKTLRQAPADETSISAQLLLRGGYVDKLMAGVYTYLPLGLRVLSNIEKVVREEMNDVGGNELLLPALHPREIWEETGRWADMKDIMYQFKGRGGQDFCLGTTHEEPIVAMLRNKVQSYKDLPLALYQIQDKFRNEPRAKSGVLRGREFLMKDMYSFHTITEDLNKYYETVKQAYMRIYKRLGLDALVVEASGGTFSKEFSHEFQVLTPGGEDTIFHCPTCAWAQNKEVAKVKEGDKCPACGKDKIVVDKGIEVGNIFKLNEKYSKAMKLVFMDEQGKQQFVQMGCYGMGISRLLGSIVEVNHDDNGIIWPPSVSPFSVHLLLLNESQASRQLAADTYEILQAANIGEVLYDDRKDISAGIKLAEADLLGISIRLVVSDKNNGLLEYKLRNQSAVQNLTADDALKKVKDYYNV